MLKKIIIGSTFFSSSLFAGFGDNIEIKYPDSVEMYIGFGVAYNNAKYNKSNEYNFNSTGSACQGNPCGALLTDPTLVTSSVINYSKSNKNSNYNITPTLGVNFNFDRFNFAIEGSYFFNDTTIRSSAKNWKTLPTNPNGINDLTIQGTSFIIPPMGETINASVNEKLGDIFTLSVLPGYQFNEWLNGFLKIGWATTKFSSNSQGGTRGGAGFLGISGNYSKRLHGLLLGFGLETKYKGYNFRLEYNRMTYGGFSKTSTELGSTANTNVSITTKGPFLDTITQGALNYQGITKTKYKKITNDIVMLSVIKKFDIFGD